MKQDNNPQTSQALLLVNPDQLRELVSEALADALASTQHQEEDRLLNVQRTAELLEVDRSTLWRWERTQYLKPVRIGSKVYYREKDVKDIKEGRL